MPTEEAPLLFRTPAAYCCGGTQLHGTLSLYGRRPGGSRPAQLLFEQDQSTAVPPFWLKLPLPSIYGVHLSPPPSATSTSASSSSLSSLATAQATGNAAAADPHEDDDTANSGGGTTIFGMPLGGGASSSRRQSGLHGSKHSLAKVQLFPHYLQSSRVVPQSLRFTVFTLLPQSAVVSPSSTSARPTRPITRRPAHKTFTFAPALGEINSGVDQQLQQQQQRLRDLAFTWVTNIRSALFNAPIGVTPPMPRVLVLINPFGGRRNAERIYERYVKPLFQIAGIAVTVKLTEYALHAKEIGQTLDVMAYDAVATVSGDGLFHELINGLMERDDWRDAIQLPLGIIPAGSGNALAKSIDTMFPDVAALNIIHGCTRPFDLFAFRVLNDNNNPVRYGFLEVMWGFIADVDLESDAMRWAGSARFTLTAVARVMNLRKYRGKIFYVPHQPEANETDNNGNHVVQPASVETADITNAPQPNTRIPLCHTGQVDLAGLQAGQLPTGWAVVEDTNFAYFMAMNAPWCSSDVLPAPFARLGDGALDLVWIADGTARKMLRFLLDTESGTYINEPFVRKEKARAFVLVPDPTQAQYCSNSLLDVDGERVEYQPLAVECLPQCSRLIVPEQHDEEIWSRHLLPAAAKQSPSVDT